MTTAVGRSTAPLRFWLACVVVLIAAAAVRLGALSELPRGLHVDEGFHLLQAQAIAEGRSLPVFITGNYGNEPGFAYVTALAIRLIGPQAWAGRWAAASAGLLTIALVIRTSLELFPGRRVLAIAAGGALAGLYWHLHFSRYGSQPILAPLAACAVVAALAHSWRTGSHRASVAAGLALGASLYGYVVMRLFPFAVLSFAACSAFARRDLRKRIVARTLLAFGVAAIVAAPLAVFFINNPGWFLNRASQITTVSGTSGLAAVVDQALKTIGGLFWLGDRDARYNLPGRPALDILQIALFLLGLAALARGRRDASVWVVALWAAVGLVPSLITEGAPQFGRTTLATPALALILAFGLELLYARLTPRLGATVVSGIALASLALTAYDYFVRYAPGAGTFAALNGDEWTIAQGLRSAPGDARLYGTPIQRDYYLDYATAGGRLSREQFGAWDRGYWSIAYLLGPDAYSRFTGYNGRECVVLPGRGTAWYMIRADQGDRASALLSALPGVRRDVVDPGVAGYRFDRFMVDRPTEVVPPVAMSIRFPGLATLVGTDAVPAAMHAGDPLTVALWWRVEAQTPEPYKLFLHVRSDADESAIVVQRDAEPCLNSLPTWAWLAGDIVYDVATMTLPADLAPGRYRVIAGWYQANGDGGRRPAEDLEGQALGDSVQVLTFEVVP